MTDKFVGISESPNSRLLKKGSECFENLSMNGKSSAISKALRSS
jgi:hypothetical protein